MILIEFIYDWMHVITYKKELKYTTKYFAYNLHEFIYSK